MSTARLGVPVVDNLPALGVAKPSELQASYGGVVRIVTSNYATTVDSEGD